MVVEILCEVVKAVLEAVAGVGLVHEGGERVVVYPQDVLQVRVPELLVRVEILK